MILLFWVNDPTPGQSGTDKLLDFVEEMINRLRLLVRMPVFANYCTGLSNILEPMFGCTVE
jgi:hypothetical protein